jgi:Putative methyltransferase
MPDDWYAWHEQYDKPGTWPGLAWRLGVVRERIRAALDEAPGGQLRAISLCAGQGLDLIGALAGHPRRHDVTARLVELDPRNTGAARRLAAEAGLRRVQVVTGDASLTSQYADMVPACLVLACGLFGNLTDADIEATIGYCTQLCATGGTVIWTRARWDPDLSPRVCEWFEERGFERVWLSDASAPGHQRVGAHRFTGTPAPLEENAVMFTFIGHEIGKGPPRAR